MSDSRPRTRSILDASPQAARWVWMINGVLFAIGASVSTFMYLSGSHSKEIVNVGRTGNVWIESVEWHLFSLPFFQLVLFVLPLMIDLNWPRFQLVVEDCAQLQRDRDPRFKQLDTAILYFGICFMLTLAGLIVLVLALSAASTAHSHNSLHAG